MYLSVTQCLMKLYYCDYHLYLLLLKHNNHLTYKNIDIHNHCSLKFHFVAQFEQMQQNKIALSFPNRNCHNLYLLKNLLSKLTINLKNNYNYNPTYSL